ncbi:uncharacterized protein LOC123264667 isoform X2 [Cotesia glomerata]|nr:uncharacterized protein LOC123264667 isoform X2 [Cotesia glomerata]
MICDDYQHHPCLNDYDDVHLDENYYFYPLLGDKETSIRRAILRDGREGLIEDSIYGNKENCCQNSFKSPPETQKSTKRRNTAASKTSKKKLSDEEIEHLIIEVQNRIPLWNFNISLAERTREITVTLWEEVSAALNGK